MLIKRIDFLSKLGLSNLKAYKHKIGQKIDIVKLEEDFLRYYPEQKNICSCGNTISFKTTILGMFNKNKETYIGYQIACDKCNKYGVTKDKMILKYGLEEGTKRWSNYCNRQSVTNTFEYKSEKYGWTKEEFHAYNLTRTVTLDNQIKAYGEEEGTKRYKEYVEKQRYSGCSLEYFQEKYGLEDGKLKYEKINKSKAQTLEAFIKRYGVENGTSMYDTYRQKSLVKFASKVSQELFDSILKQIENNGHIYYSKLNKEFFLHDQETKTSYFYDYVDTIRKKVIEFNGICFHAKSEDDVNFKNHFLDITAKEIFEKDLKKKRLIENRGYKMLYVWEDDYYKDKEKELEKCISFLKDCK